ncbi:hypothetical protein PR048_019749 [Dryococelus australis]|uniref:Uncharacterized protein n=1 Tax=Dryococelus australis TaxID=614101 RepID=A0ABQ9H4P2_9NEOP|nr:hypothetical protein PR048_019749 [Dryococelus australis]
MNCNHHRLFIPPPFTSSTYAPPTPVSVLFGEPKPPGASTVLPAYRIRFPCIKFALKFPSHCRNFTSWGLERAAEFIHPLFPLTPATTIQPALLVAAGERSRAVCPASRRGPRWPHVAPPPFAFVSRNLICTQENTVADSRCHLLVRRRPYGGEMRREGSKGCGKREIPEKTRRPAVYGAALAQWSDNWPPNTAHRARFSVTSPRFSHVGNVADVAFGLRVFLGSLLFINALALRSCSIAQTGAQDLALICQSNVKCYESGSMVKGQGSLALTSKMADGDVTTWRLT